MTTKTTTATEGQGGVALMLRRAILLLAVAALVAAMVAVSAMPAMAKVIPEKPGQNGGGPPGFSGGPGKNVSSEVVHEPDGACVVHFGGRRTGGAC